MKLHQKNELIWNWYFSIFWQWWKCVSKENLDKDDDNEISSDSNIDNDR